MEPYRRLENAKMLTETDESVELKVFFNKSGVEYDKGIWFLKEHTKQFLNEFGEISFYVLDSIIQKEKSHKDFMQVSEITSL